jgi:hypothetical protein
MRKYIKINNFNRVTTLRTVEALDSIGCGNFDHEYNKYL